MSGVFEKILEALIKYIVSHPEVVESLVEKLVAYIIGLLEDAVTKQAAARLAARNQ